MDLLTKKEHTVMKYTCLGYSNKEIANKMYVTESTIKTHIHEILLKLEATNRTKAIYTYLKIYKNIDIEKIINFEGDEL